MMKNWINISNIKLFNNRKEKNMIHSFIQLYIFKNFFFIQLYRNVEKSTAFRYIYQIAIPLWYILVKQIKKFQVKQQ